jgi:hypothetical protein
VNSAVHCFFPWTRGRRSDSSDLSELRSRFDTRIIVLRRAAEIRQLDVRPGRKMVAQSWRNTSWQIGECRYTPTPPPKR